MALLPSWPQPNRRRRRAILAATGAVTVAVIVIGLAAAGVFSPKHPAQTASPSPTSPSSSASIVDGKVVTEPALNGSSFAQVYTDGTKPELVDPDDRHFFDDWLAPILSTPANLRGWQLCKAELLAEARATQSYADAVSKYPNDKPYNLDPAKEAKNTAGYFTERAQIMRTAAALAEQSNIACIDEPTSTSHWLQFAVQVDGKPRQIAVPDGYILLFAFETGEQITLTPSICVPHTHIRWEDVNRRKLADTVNPNGETFSERAKYQWLEQLAAEEDLERAMGRATCLTS